MTSVRMAWSEIRRITAGRLPRMAVVALILIPALYGGLYLYANHDPYANLKNVPAALVVEDEGARDSDGNDVNAGRDVAEELMAGDSFDWQETTAADAASGVEEGTFDFALTIPRDFSAALTSSATFDPEQAQLRMTTNDANSYLSTTIASNVTERVRDALAVRVGTEAASNFLLGISETRAGLLEATKGATGLLGGIERAKTGTDKLAGSADQLSDGATELGKGLGTIVKKTKELPDQLSELATGSREVADANKDIAAIGDRVASLAGGGTKALARMRVQLRSQLTAQGMSEDEVAQVLAVFDGARGDVVAANRKVQDAAKELGRLATGAGEVATATEKLATDVPELLEGVADAQKGSNRLTEGAEGLAGGARQLNRGLTALSEGGTQLRDGLQEGADRIPVMDGKTRDKIAQTIGNPVDVDSISTARAQTYGEGLAPFFLPLAAWIGGYALFLLLRPLSTRAMAANQSPMRVAIGGWLPAALIGSAQMAILSVAVLFALGVKPVHVVGTFSFLLLTSATFIAILHCLNAWFGRAGQFLGLVLMVLQLVTAGGTFPWQTIPPSMHWLHQVLPMSYAVDGLRQLMYGGLGSRVGVAVAVLVGYFVVSLLLTGHAARRQRVWSVQRIRPELAL
ncbi:MAG TPA: YhgE/Pip domain-containing protein [Nocardioidaceae bacterium]|nr:YhgE/Pip domain-containing protein [Nocardioidaceae bacterium]